MRFFPYFADEEMERLFHLKPRFFQRDSDREFLSFALGATLYMPATRPNILEDIYKQKQNGLTSIVIDLEDAVGDLEVQKAEKCFAEGILSIWHKMNSGLLHFYEFPLLFFRVRNLAQFNRVLKNLGEAIELLTGVVIPKFAAETGKEFLMKTAEISTNDHPFYMMPILESDKIIKKETRWGELLEIKQLLDAYREYVLNVRIGATDFSGLYGIRRSADTTVYDIAVLRDCIADIINVFQRSDCPYVISGPVWEYFSSKERMLKPQLRQTPFRERYGDEGLKWRAELIDRHMDGLIREILMDVANGLTGKTIIHPSHIRVVQALNVVSYEEYLDALHITESATGEVGVKKSQFSNKMNEIKPHFFWAKRILMKSQVYGVLNEEYTNIDLINQKVFV